ncbi:MAG: cell wall-active antibiotics response protein [Bacteroidota bacterium]|nr:cell wall-active antibiotics response protein [Bacteroidota bacterium]
METNNFERNKRLQNSRIWSGFVLLAAGLLLLAYKMGAPIPGWMFTWPVLLIAIGLLAGIKSNFRNPGSFIMILIGTIFLADQSIPGINFHNYIAPIIFISLGLFFILRPKHSGWERRNRFWNEMNLDDASASNNFKPGETSNGDNAEFIDVNAVFGGVKKNILSKNFKGGEIVSFMGGSEINFMQADIQHPVILEVHNVFGGTKLIVPSNWDVQNEISAVFGGIEDKRTFNSTTPDSNKKILLKGTCVFGGIEVTNY